MNATRIARFRLAGRRLRSVAGQVAGDVLAAPVGPRRLRRGVAKRVQPAVAVERVTPWRGQGRARQQPDPPRDVPGSPVSAGGQRGWHGLARRREGMDVAVTVVTVAGVRAGDECDVVDAIPVGPVAGELDRGRARLADA